MPFSLSIEPTNHCNLNCLECPSGNGESDREKGYMNFETYKKIIDEMKSTLINLTLHFQGEPLLNKEISRFISYADQNNIHTMLSTNAQNLSSNFAILNNSGLQKIIISLDGLSQNTYQKYRKNGDINKVYDALQTISLTKNRKTYIELQFIVFSHNEHEINKLKQLKKQYKINKISIKTAQIYNHNELIPSTNKLSRYTYINNKKQIKFKLKDKCFRMYSSAVITWNGKVLPCCFDKNANFVMGNLNNENFKLIWNNEKYLAFRKKIFNSRSNIEMCNNCIEK